MRFEPIERKSSFLIDEKNNQSVMIDLFSEFISFDKNEIPLVGIVIINSFNVNRLDKIAKNFYGNTNDLWILTKFNGISNNAKPVIGQEIQIPDKDVFLRNVQYKNVSKVRIFNLLNKPIESSKLIENSRSILKERQNSTFYDNGKNLVV